MVGPSKAQPGAHGRQIVAVRRAGKDRKPARSAAADVRPIQIAFEAEDDTVDLKVEADCSAYQSARYAEVSARGHSGYLRLVALPPYAAAVDADIEASPVVGHICWPMELRRRWSARRRRGCSNICGKRGADCPECGDDGESCERSFHGSPLRRDRMC